MTGISAEITNVKRVVVVPIVVIDLPIKATDAYLLVLFVGQDLVPAVEQGRAKLCVALVKQGADSQRTADV